MSDTIRTLAAHPTVAAARQRDPDQFFGQGWSHYPLPFRGTTPGGVDYYLALWNTPNHWRVNWSLRDAGTAPHDYSEGTHLYFCLTPEESHEVAVAAGLPAAEFAAWLVAALEACRTDVTAEAVARHGNVADLANFHASRTDD